MKVILAILLFILFSLPPAVLAPISRVAHHRLTRELLIPELSALQGWVCGSASSHGSQPPSDPDSPTIPVIPMHPVSLLSPLRFDLPAKILYGRLRRLGARTRWGHFVYREHLNAFNRFQEKRFETHSNAWEKFGAEEFFGMNTFFQSA